jgi:hypothetical protein
MTRLHLQGGFGEKGRTSIGIEAAGRFVMLDAGIKVGAPAAGYHPHLARPARGIDALFISHAHEDHIGALCHLLAQGYRGPVWMTPETRAEMAATLAQYARPEDLRAHPPETADIRLFAPGDTVEAAGMAVATGLSGHVAGGVWFAVAAAGRRIVYSGDIVPGSAVFPMTPMPVCDLLVLDCSYGTDPVPASARAREIAAWVAAHPGASVLPTPLSGRSLELLAVLDGPLAIAADMRAPLLAQIGSDSVCAGAAARLRARLAQASDWRPGTPLPDRPLLVHDGMGTAGPAGPALDAARASRVPVLLSGHLPAGSPGQKMRAAGLADWVRMPTHPTLPENRAIWQAAGRPRLLGHSCEPDALAALAAEIPGLEPGARTGDVLDL